VESWIYKRTTESRTLTTQNSDSSVSCQKHINPKFRKTFRFHDIDGVFLAMFDVVLCVTCSGHTSKIFGERKLCGFVVFKFISIQFMLCSDFEFLVLNFFFL